MNACPNYNSPEWKLLEQKAGSYDAAFDVFIKNNNETPSIEEINELYKEKEKIDITPETIKKQLGELPYFRTTKEGEVFLKNKNVYPQAISAIAKINKQISGFVKFNKVNSSTNGWRVDINQGQQPLFDLPTTKKNNLLLNGFKSFYQQKEVVDVISSNILAYYRDNKDKKPNFKQAVESFKFKLEELNKNQSKEIYQTILTNLESLSIQVRGKLQSLNLISKPRLEGTTLESTTEIIENQDETIEGSEEIGSSIDNEWTFKYDSKDNALQQIKKFLAFTPKTVYKPESGEFKLVQSVIPNQPSFMGYDEVYEQLKAILSGVDNTWEAVEQELLLYEKGKPFIHTLLKRINNYKEDKEQLKRQFVSTMSSSYSGFKTIIIKDKIDNQSGAIIGQYFNIIDTDRSSIEKTILSKWQGNFKRSKLFNINEGIVDPEKVREYQQKIKEIKKDPSIENVEELLNDIGIDLSRETLDKLVNGIVNKLNIKQQFESTSGLFNLINLRLNIKEDRQDDDQENDLDQELSNDPNINNSAIKGLAKLESQNSEYYYSNTFKDGEGNTVYSYTFNKFLTKEFNKLLNNKNYVKDLLEITFNKPILDQNNNPLYNTWLNQLDNNPIFKQVFNISPLDTLKVGRNGTKLTSMSDLDLEITQLALIQNSGRRKKGLGEDNKKGTRLINYLLTVPDKTTSYVIQGTGIDIKLFFNEDKTFKIDNETRKILYSIVVSEHNRILSQQTRKSTNKSYNSGSNKFFFFPTLNDLIFNEDKTVKLPTDKIENKTVEEIIKNEIDRIIIQDINNKIENWKDLGIIKNNQLVLIDSNYYNSILKQQSNNIEEQLNIAAADYIINSLVAKFNTSQIFIDDPAVYFKSNVKTTWDNIGKRLTNLIAPFKEGMIDKNNKYFLSVKLDDRVTSALNHSQLESRLSKYYNDQNINLPYNDIKGTDAQEYTTLTEKLKVLYSFGEISTELYNNLIDKIKEQGDNLVLDKEELDKLIFIADKPVYSSRIVSKEDDVVYREYIKSSSLPLLPQFTKGLEIDKLRKSMENLEKKTGKSVRVAFNTATKLGGKGSINIWNEDSTIKDNLDLELYAITLDRSNFGIQQEVPYDETKDETVRSTQVLKLLFDSIDENNKGFRLDQKIYNGEELKQIYNNLQKELYEKSLVGIEKRLIKDGQLVKQELITILKNEGIKRGYSPAQLSFLETNLEKTDFSLPFWAHTNNNKEQSMLTSIWTNKILKQKMPGGSYVLVSEEGMQGRSVDIVYTKSYDSKVGLKPMRIVYKKDKIQLEENEYIKLSKEEKQEYKEIVKPAQVLISWNLRDRNGKLLDRNNYITKDEEGNTFIDTTKVPKDILNQFGFRIPNQGHNSMSLIEIAGFLPDIYQGVVIASRNFVTQMGSDFDIDKLYIYSYYLDVDKEGNIHKQDDLKNKLVDIHKSVLFNKEIFNQIVKPLDLGRISYETSDKKLKGIAEELKKKEEQNRRNYLNPDYSKAKYLQSIDGKAMVGITSVANTFNTLLQGKNISLQKTVIIKDRKELVSDNIVFEINGKIRELSDLSSAFSISGRRKNELHQAIQSAAVDNGNNPLLSYINANPQTSSVLTLMIDLGLEEEEIYGLLSQPVIKEYVKRVKASKSDLTDNIREEDILSDLIKEYKADKYQEDYPLSINHLNQVLFDSKKTNLTNEEIQTLVLAKFNKIKSYGDKLQRIANLLNIESKGVGKSLLELADRRRSIDKIFNITSFSNLNNLLGEFNQGELEPNTISGYALVNSIYAADDVIKQSNLMPYGLQTFNNIIEQFENLTGRDATTDNKYEIWKAVKAYQFAKFFTQDDRKSLFFDNNNQSLNTRINNLLKTKLKNNQFILRLDLSQVDLSGKNPSYIFYNSSKEADIEEINTYQAFYELVFNQDQEIRSIGQDLVKYFYINGGSPNSKDWGRYISAEMLEDIGLSEFVKDINFSNEETYGTKEGISDVLFQLFQHKPYLTTKLISKNFVQKKDIILINQDNIPRELVYNLGIKSIFNLNNNLYKLEAKDDKGNYIYKQISKLGKKFYNEYYSESIKENEDDYREKIQPEDINKINNTYENPLIIDEFKGLLNVNISEALSNINSNKYNKEISKLFKKVERLIGNIEIEGVESNEFYFGRWDKKTIRVNLKELKNKGTLNRKTVEGIVLKEIVHVLNTRLFDSTFTPTSGQIQAKSAINNLYNSIRDRILSGELTQWNKEDFIKYEEILKKYRNKQQISESEKNFLLENKAKYYGLTHVEDFLHDALLQDEFRELINQIKYDNKKSLLDRISDLIKDILKGFRELVEIKEGSALEEAFTQLIKLTETGNFSNITFEEELIYGYKERTIKNASADATIALAIDFNTAGEKLTKSSVLAQNKKYIPVNLNESDTIDTDKIVKELNSINAKTLNIAGNGIYTFNKEWSQKQLDSYLYDFLKDIINDPNLNNKIELVRTGGQTGVDEAGAKAANRLGIKTLVLAPKGWVFRNSKSQDISNESQFKARFIQQNENDESLFDLPHKNKNTKIKEDEEKNYKKVIDDFELRLKRISDDISKAYISGNKELATSLKNRLKDVKKEQEDLIADNTLETLIKYANNDFEYIEKILKKPELTENDLEYSSLVLGTWSNIDNIDIYKVLTSYDARIETPKGFLIREIAEKANRLKTRIREAKLEIGIKLTKEVLKRDISREDLTLSSDIGYAQSKFRDISTSNNIVLDIVDKLVRTADFQTVTELNKLIEKGEDLTKKINLKNIITREDFADTFGQLNKNGELTGELVDALSYNYFETRNILLNNISEAPNPKEKQEASEKYYNWIKENHIIVDVNKLFEETENGTFKYQPRENYLKAISKILGEDYSKVIEEARDKIKAYNEELILQINANKDNPDGDRNLEIWKLENSPLIYFDNLMNGLTIRKVGGDIIKNQGWKFIAKRANKEWEDNRYNEIQKDEDLKAYYNWYVQTMKELNEILPYNIHKNLKTTDIPSISKSLLEELHDTGINKYHNRTWSALLEELSVKKNEPIKFINPETRTVEKEFSFQYIDKLNPQDKSYNLTQVIKLFAAQAIGYKYKAQIEDKIRLTQSILNESLEQQTKSNGELTIDKFGKTTTPKGLNNLKDQINYAIDASFYGIKKEHTEGKSKIEFITPIDKERLAKEIEEVEAMDITEASKTSKIFKLKDKYTRALTWSKVGDFLLQYTQLKGMGWNVFGGINNIAFGQLANYNWSATGIDFNDKDLSKAIGVMLQAQSPIDSDAKKKVEALMIKFNTVKQLRDKIYSATTNYNKSRKGLHKLSPYELYAQGEYFVQGQVMIALLNAKKIKVTENGIEKEISLYEALDNNGNWNTEKYGENKEYSELGEKTLEFKFKLDSLLKKIHGNYDPNSSIAINKRFFGRALIQFRRWIPEGIAQRFDSEKYDEYLQRNTKGRWNTYYDLGWKDSIKTLLKLAITRGKDSSFNNLGLEGSNLEIVKENMKKNLREIYFKLSILGLYLILSGIGDDDEWKRRGRNFSINTVLRLQDDIEFYYSPKAFDNITRSALPVANLIKDFENFSSAFIDTLEGNGDYKSGIHSGDSKLLWKTAKILPFGAAVTNLINKGENQETFRK